MNENKSQMTPIATDAPFLMNALSHPAYGLGKDLVRAVAAVRWFWVPFLAFVITRLAIIGVAYLALPFIQDASDTVYHLRGTDNFFVDAFGSRWDTGFYVSIAEEGYIADGVRFPNVPFFSPLTLDDAGLDSSGGGHRCGRVADYQPGLVRRNHSFACLGKG